MVNLSECAVNDRTSNIQTVQRTNQGDGGVQAASVFPLSAIPSRKRPEDVRATNGMPAR